MKRYPVLLVFLALALSTAWTSVRSYQTARREIHDDLRQALQMTRAEGPSDWLTTDTVRQFRSHITSPTLRGDAQLAFLLSDDGRLRVRPYVTYSSLRVWRMSDQRLSFALGLMSLLWAAVGLRRARQYGGELVTEALGDGALPRLTPMQERLMSLFMASPGGRLTKREICDTLWPGKPDATDSLYTLIRRTKQTLGTAGPYRIEADRGRSYRLRRIP